jgi:hypothetical protein
MKKKKLKDVRITILIQDKDIEFKFYDYLSCKTFFIFSLNFSNFIKALGRLAYVKCKSASVLNLAYLNKKMIHKPFSLRISKSLYSNSYSKRKEIEDLIKKKCPEGWIPDLYLNSQDSFKIDHTNNQYFVNTIIRKYIKET